MNTHDFAHVGGITHGPPVLRSCFSLAVLLLRPHAIRRRGAHKITNRNELVCERVRKKESRSTLMRRGGARARVQFRCRVSQRRKRSEKSDKEQEGILSFSRSCLPVSGMISIRQPSFGQPKQSTTPTRRRRWLSRSVQNKTKGRRRCAQSSTKVWKRIINCAVILP